MGPYLYTGADQPQEYEPVPPLVFLPSPLADVVVDPTVRFQTHEGFGASLAWFANIIGGWPDANRSAIADLLFDPYLGLGLNTLRCNIGGGENPSHDHMRVGAMWPDFSPVTVSGIGMPTPKRWMLKAAQQRAGKAFIAEAFANSPPYWMTSSQCAAGRSQKWHIFYQGDGYFNLKTAVKCQKDA